MPFDGHDATELEHRAAHMESLPPRERLAWLGDQLGKPIPVGFKWDYDDCKHCALGLYEHLTGRSPLALGFPEFGISHGDFHDIFWSPGRIFSVTPRKVQARINRVINRSRPA